MIAWATLARDPFVFILLRCVLASGEFDADNAFSTVTSPLSTAIIHQVTVQPLAFRMWRYRYNKKRTIEEKKRKKLRIKISQTENGEMYMMEE